MADFVAYIDEAGDEGIGKLRNEGVQGQSRWLAIGACIVSRETDLALPRLRDGILERFPKRKARDLHFRDLNHGQKVVACQEIAKAPIGVCVTLSHKVTLLGSPWEATFKQKGYLYNYLVRWLIERLSVNCRAVNGGRDCSLRLVFSRRGGTDYHSMRRYLERIRDGDELVKPVRSIDWGVLNLDDIAVEGHGRWAGLQIADCVTSAFFSGVEPDIYGNYEPRYASLLTGNVLRRGRSGLNHGVVPVPSLAKSRCDEAQQAFFMSFVGEK